MNVVAFVFVAFLIFLFSRLILLLFRYSTNWHKLERAYLVSGELLGNYRIFGYQRLRFITNLDAFGVFNQLNWMISVGFNESGVVFRPNALTRPVFRTIVVPWDKLVFLTEGFIGIDRRTINFIDFPDIQIVVSSDLYSKLQESRAKMLAEGRFDSRAFDTSKDLK